MVCLRQRKCIHQTLCANFQCKYPLPIIEKICASETKWKWVWCVLHWSFFFIPWWLESNPLWLCADRNHFDWVVHVNTSSNLQHRPPFARDNRKNKHKFLNCWSFSDIWPANSSIYFRTISIESDVRLCKPLWHMFRDVPMNSYGIVSTLAFYQSDQRCTFQVVWPPQLIYFHLLKPNCKFVSLLILCKTFRIIYATIY